MPMTFLWRKPCFILSFKNENLHPLKFNQSFIVLTVQKLLSGSGRAGKLRLMEKYIGHRLVARRELDNTYWTDSTRQKMTLLK